MIIGIQEEILRLNALGLLDRLLADKTTKSNVLWATDAYSDMGSDYRRDKEIKAPLITGEHSGIIKNRARKALEQQFERTRQHAEVFTPLWVCAKMNDYADEVWFGRPEVFTKDGEPTERVDFPQNKRWQRYVDSRRLEITCGEAPYLVSRYDVSTGESIPIERRIGILDRKLRVVNENTYTEDEWLKWAFRAFRATYGYELQGDNVLISRVNLLTTFEEYLAARWNRKPTPKEYASMTNIIAWNLWQMDGLTAAPPFCCSENDERQLSLFDPPDPEANARAPDTPLKCRIKNWLGCRSVEVQNLPIKGEHGMKFDFIIGNPPYQEETQGTSDKPVYNYFMDGAYSVSDKVLLITPARFLFNAGKTPKAWNEKMLSDPHLKVSYFTQKSEAIFTNTDIKGGVAITYRDANKDFGAIGAFSSFSELNGILRKVVHQDDFATIDDIIVQQNRWLLDELYKDHPEAKNKIGSKGTERRLTTPIFSSLSVFHDEPTSEDYKIVGLINNKRFYRYVNKKYIDSKHENLFKYKVILSASTGTGALGEALSMPLVGEPLMGFTQSFIGFGAFETEEEANAVCKYIKTKFARTLLGTLKVTQHNHKGTWRHVPLQDFTPESDIDWSKSIPEIDQQLYAKYGLDESEIAFIESHVKEMK